jgi:hypothetical protein
VVPAIVMKYVPLIVMIYKQKDTLRPCS